MPRVAEGVVTARASALVTRLGQARGHALAAGALAIACATAPTSEERAALAAALQARVRRYRDAIAAGASARRVPAGKSRLTGERAIVHAFDARLAALPPDGRGLTRQDAVDLSRVAQEEVVPAIYRVLAVVQEDDAAEEERRLGRMRDKAAIVDGMVAEMSRIGRTISIISINASVEAARAGGETGRAFQVIAEEIRGLATRSAELLAGMKASLADDPDGAAADRAPDAPRPPPSPPPAAAAPAVNGATAP